MKYILITLCIGAAALAGCSNSGDKKIAETAKALVAAPSLVKADPPAPAKPPSPEQISSSMAGKYDINKDTQVSSQEMLSVTVGNLLKGSKRGDKTLNSDEFHAELGDKSLKDKDISKVFEKVDTNQDKVLSEKELAAYVWPSIEAMNHAPVAK